jgi:nucleoside-diphosphate-sugar epimerase
MKKKLLITGASGFLGYHLIEAALLKGFEVFAGVRSSSAVSHLDSRVTVVQLNLPDTAGTKHCLEQHGIQYIIHAAALTKAKTEKDYNFSNAVLTRNLAQAAMEAQIGLQKFVFISSLAALGPSHNGQAVKEDDIPQPLTWYGKSKLLAEQYLASINYLPFIVFRPTAVFGPREKDLLLVIKSVNRGMEMYIGRAAQKLSFVYVKDLADVTIAALESERKGEFYNISDGSVYSKYAFADAVKKFTGKKAIRLQLPPVVINAVALGMDKLYSFSSKTPALNLDKVKELTAANWSCSIDKCRRELGFHPVYNLETGMAETIAWYKENKWI